MISKAMVFVPYDEYQELLKIKNESIVKNIPENLFSKIVWELMRVAADEKDNLTQEENNKRVFTKAMDLFNDGTVSIHFLFDEMDGYPLGYLGSQPHVTIKIK